MLGKEQWEWLEAELLESSAAIHIIVSSVQVLTTNPAMESWGHFPKERRRLLQLLSRASGATILSGDVHHGEILDPRAGLMKDDESNNPQTNGTSSLLEVTSSGMTHVCSQQGMYGALCEPLLTLFHRHRFAAKTNYYLHPNFGTLHVDWDAKSFRVNVHSVGTGEIVLSTGDRFFDPRPMTDEERDRVLAVMDGHLQPLALSVILATAIFFGLWKTRARSCKA